MNNTSNMHFPLTLSVLLLSLSLFCEASSRLGQVKKAIVENNEPWSDSFHGQNDPIAALRTRDKPPPNKKPPHLSSKLIVQGQAFWYYGIEDDSFDFNFYEHLWEELVEVVDFAINSGFSDDVYKTWFADIEAQVVERMFKVIQENITPKNITSDCKTADSPKMWIVVGDPDKQCNGHTVAYTQSVSNIYPRPKQMNADWKEGDYYMAFCEDKFASRPTRLFCSSFQGRKFTKNKPLVFTMLHELVWVSCFLKSPCLFYWDVLLLNSLLWLYTDYFF